MKIVYDGREHVFTDKDIEFLHCLLCAGLSKLEDGAAGGPEQNMVENYGIDIDGDEFEQRKKRIESAFDFIIE